VPTIYKIVSAELWRAAEREGSFPGAPVDLKDGFIHFSAVTQIAETAAKHFAGERDLLLVSVDCATLASALRWEPSRGGALFPHLYAALDVKLVTRVDPLPLDENGIHHFPTLDL